jgi:glucose-6-phosphate 1-dehydrogenase
MRSEAPSPPCALVIFGASGDLAHRKLLPALYNLEHEGLLPAAFAVIGLARTPTPHEGFRKAAAEDIRRFVPGAKASVIKALTARMYYLPGDVGDPGSFQRLKAALAQADARHKTRGNALFYMATGPQFFAPIAEALARHGLLSEDKGFRRLVVEKPFGRDLASARELNGRLLAVARERQIFRIDHYLGKETVQNLLVFRFGNAIFEPIWNRRYVDHVQITVAEDLGVEKRGGYYDHAGALRDMVPNHIFQLISLVAMEPPYSFEADAVREEQSKVIRAFRELSKEGLARQVVRGQYTAGRAEGGTVPGYRQEASVARSSRTETFVAMKLFIDNWRWADVPWVFRTGKRLPCRSTEIVVQFRRAPLRLFKQEGIEALAPNQIVIRIQPNEGISLNFEAKRPGPSMRLGTVNMDFRYEDYFGSRPQTGYERLLHDAMLGDATLFRRADALEAGWAFLAPVQEAWKRSRARPRPYPAGTWGPREAEELLGRSWRRWRACAAR